MKRLQLLAPLTAVALTLCASGAWAQQPPVAPAPAPTAAVPAPVSVPAHPAPQTPEGAKRQQMVEKQLKALHDKLKITPSQQSFWDAFAEARRNNVDSEDALIKQRPPAEQQTALDMMQDYAKMTQAYAENVQHVLPSFEALYHSLSPEQKKIADQSFAQRRHEMMQHANHD